MNVHDFLNHHGITKNPFAEEDAQTDPIFKDYCISHTYHPAWDKIFGNPSDPSTSIVFGEKGSGKTALRLQVDKHLTEYNEKHLDARCFVIHYDDFNPFLDHFCERLGRRSSRKASKVLLEFQLWDHMDAILSLGVTQLIDQVLAAPKRTAPEDSAMSVRDLRVLDRHQRRDLMLLAACYDGSNRMPQKDRWRQLKHRLGFWTVKAWWPFAAGILVQMAVIAVALAWVFAAEQDGRWERWTDLLHYWWVVLLISVAGWLPWLIRLTRRWWLSRSIARRIRVIPRQVGLLCRSLMQFTSVQLAGQPLPNHDRTDDRYSQLRKMQSILNSLGYSGIVVLVDRVDEPHLINGSAESMRALLWPMLDNKFLKQPGIGIKFMLPSELTEFIDREDREFYQRARLDKQNMVPSLEWTGPALSDVANARLAACAEGGKKPKLRDLIDESISQERLFDLLRELRVPRHMFRFLHRVVVAHCNKHSDQTPVWKIANDTLESEFAVYRRSLDAADRGLGVG